MACISTTKARCGSGRMTAPTAQYHRRAAPLARRDPDGQVDPALGRSAYHRAKTVWSAAAGLNITLMPLPGYRPDLMAVEPLWRWLREDVTYQRCHATAEDLIRRVAAFEADVNADPWAVADRLWVKDHLDPEEEKLRFSE